MAHWFFFSYARVNKHRYLKKFYEDLWTNLTARLTAAEQTQRSFRDWEDLELMSRWIRQLQDGLEWSRVLVSIVSPAYVSQEWCGKEVAFFEQLGTYHYGAPEHILPVIWSPVELPSALSPHQYTHDSLPDSYFELGLFRIMSRGMWPTYAKCVDAFAEGILKKGRSYPARGPKPGLSLGTVSSAFQIKEAFRTRVVYWSTAGRNWQPFLPPQDRDEKAEELVETVIARRQIGIEELQAGAPFTTFFQQSTENDPVVILLDPRVAQQNVASFATLDREKHKTTALFVPWNEQDPGLSQDRETIQKLLSESITPRIAVNHPPIRCTKELQQELNATLERFQQLATLRNSEGRTVTDSMVRVSGNSSTAR